MDPQTSQITCQVGMMQEPTIGDHIRLRSTRELYVVEEKRDVEGVTFLFISRFGRMAGSTASSTERHAVRMDEVVLQKLGCEWVDA